MLPVLFGDPAAPLYGVYHGPEPTAATSRGVVLCQPAFHECTAAHRAVRGLAEQFARAGVHALRFDYRGTGDSAGDATECDMEGWTADIGTALDELQASRGLTDVGLVGLRLGASLAAGAAARRPGLACLVLWEPIVEGRRYLEDLRLLQQAWVDFEAEQRPSARSRASADEMLGHPLPPALAAGLAALDMQAGDPAAAERVLLVDEGVTDRLDALCRRCVQAGARVEHLRVDGGRVWSRDADGEQAQVPRALLTNIVDWVAREATS
jgi:alpha/beta superfamily hydrolase